MMRITALSLLLVALAALPWGANAGPLQLTILHMNDHHSNHDPIELKITVADASTEAKTTSPIRAKFGGFTRMVTMANDIKTSEEAAGRHVLKLHAGDALTGTSYYSLFRGESDAKMMAHMCFDAFALGNHEFDDGDKSLASFIEMLGKHTALCPAVPVLGANVVPGATSPLVGKIVKSVVITKGGEKVGVVGINVKKKTEQSSFPSPGTYLTEEAAAAQAEIDSLVAASVDKIILLTHIGYATDLAKLAVLKNVDVIVGGDQHALLGSAPDVSGVGTVAGAYPTEKTNGNGKKVCVVQAWEYGKALGGLQVNFDANGDVTSCSGKPHFVYDEASMRTDAKIALNATTKVEMKAYLDSLGNFHAKAPHAATEESMSTYAGQVTSLKATKIATAPAVICMERIPGQGRSTLCKPEESAERGGGVAQLVAKAFMHRTPTANISIQNGGGCRVDIPKGDYTMNDAYTLLPFSNTIATIEMTGAQVVSLMEDALSSSHDGADPSTGAYPYAAGLRFDVNMSEAKGSRVKNVEVNSRLAGSWSNIVLTQKYVVGTNNYIAGGKDGYVTFTEPAIKSTYVDTYTEYAQIFVDYAKEVTSLVVPPASEFSTKSYVGTDGVSHTPAPAPAPTSNPVTSVSRAAHGVFTPGGALLAALLAAAVAVLC